jgi:diguanylate cyclase (GGDEF)-like protein
VGESPETLRRPEPSRMERLLEHWRPYRPRRLTARERRVESVCAVGLMLVSVVLALTVSSDRSTDVLVSLGLIATLALAFRVRLYLGAGFATPLWVVLVPMLYLVPAPLVPACVVLGLVTGTALGRAHPERLITAINDAWFAIGAALVFLAFSEPAPELASWPDLALALLAGCAVDLTIATAREWLGRGIPPALQTRVLLQVWSVDACLTAVGLAFAAAGHLGFLLAVPLLALLAALARDRQTRIEQAVAHVEELGREHARLDRAIRRIGEAFASKLDRAALLDLMVQTAVEALDADHGRVGDIAWSGRPSLRAPVDVLSAAESAARTRGALGSVRAGRHSAIAYPLGGGDRTLAVARRGRPFSAEERALLGYLAQQTAVAMENLALHDALREQATRDELTGLSNHRRFQQALAHETAVANRTGAPLALAIVDLDDFKAVNDTHGHLQGDAVLKAVGGVLRNLARASDEPARYGGEELAVILPSTDLDGAFTVAEAIRAAVEKLEIRLPGGGSLGVTVSAGVSALEGGVIDPASLIDAADVALYDAKRAGKNRTARGAWVRDGAEEQRRFSRTPTPRV